MNIKTSYLEGSKTVYGELCKEAEEVLYLVNQVSAPYNHTKVLAEMKSAVFK